MTPTFRQIAVSGSAAVALFGGAAAITMATQSPASAATQTVAHRAVTAPVQMPDGRTIRITGMGGYGHQATAGHIATVASFKTDTATTPPDATDSVGSGLTPDGGAGAAITNPVNGTQTGYNQQIVTQSAGGAIGVGVVTIAILAIIVFYKVKHGGMKTSDAVIGGLLGIALSGTVVGAMGNQLTHSLVGSLGSMLGGLS